MSAVSHRFVMFTSYPNKNLKEGEEILREVRRTWWSVIGQSILAGLLILAPFFFLVPLLRAGSLGVVGFFLALLLGIIIVFRLLILFFLNVLVVTNYRIIDVDQRGFFHRVVSETTYDKIQDVSYSIQGPWATLWHYGTIHVQTAGQQANLEIIHVRNPELIHELILRVQNEARLAGHDGQEELSAEELLNVARRLKGQLSPKRFRAQIGREKDHS